MQAKGRLQLQVLQEVKVLAFGTFWGRSRGSPERVKSRVSVHCRHGHSHDKDQHLGPMENWQSLSLYGSGSELLAQVSLNYHSQCVQKLATAASSS